MNRVWALGWILAAGAGYVYANGVATCNISGQPFASTLTATNTITGNATYSSGCATQGSFAYTDLMNWGLPTAQGGLGYATQSSYDPTVSGSWTATTAGGVGVAVNITPGYQGNNYQLSRVDNAVVVFDNSSHSWVPVGFEPGMDSQQTLQGHFNAPSASDTTLGGTNPANTNIAGLGDHLLAALNGWGPITITFNTGISGAGFLISSVGNSFTDATVQAWAVSNPNPMIDTPLQTYAIADTAGGGTCATLANSPPTPCNDAPFVAVSISPGSTQLIRAITISIPTMVNGNPYNGGFAIDQMELETVPEPAMELTIGTGLALMALLLRKKQRKPGASE